ncbi:tRNA (N6-isopentenyl adenosine(37)-C2)-methylthiotransferase MiaB [candidate division KSB1 bacterium]|nr:tRNA (N6-isopentenyl adenosine(37)-C2)-methylthiotransferase MiaB [candidate division KSB1 bacterium]NIR71369.1 tRNA (N6-isopentenyl adenosine(37)-C2)-methylthiotransferase MiaB [candidate division KSB1 bacterium]NIS26259.1 tRNA (N6-isopentenyl adenosine(37)-C2)-methylthiotransferase MiaB [candidate division KSB1 bacterium]NIT73010.1 tRNA (N6-isopentenyl adenosine(37)-C2)-methylthiotransferase MiaB [candidate division KSB1 bacterium]NIU26907.1 tRNA (N6-isopentenyl adenosine(37)-C2)-methylthi
MKKVYIETYGCQMNEYDTELIRSILKANNYEFTDSQQNADVVFLNTCAIRENAHSKIYGRLGEIKHLKERNRNVVVGLLGCMSQNLRGNLKRQEELVDIFAGPDSYKRLPAMIESVLTKGGKKYDFALSEFEDYGDVYPQRVPGVNAWIAVMRGCDNFCTFCVVPYTRGRERSRSPENVVAEVQRLAEERFKQVTLLGQNVNSYRADGYDFADLMMMVSEVDGIERIRFTSPHPKDFPDKFLEVMADNPKICNHIHLPLQAGNNRILEQMARTYTKQSFLQLVDKIRDKIPNVALTTDVIVGFSSETDADFEDTFEVMETVEFDLAFIFKYSERENTIADRKFSDDVPPHKKTERIVRLNELQKRISLRKNQAVIGQSFEVLVEGPSKKNPNEWMGRTDGNKIVIFERGPFKAGDIIETEIVDATANTLFGKHDLSAHTSARHALPILHETN